MSRLPVAAAVEYDDHEDWNDEPACHYCGGEGMGYYGYTWDNPDPLWYDENELVDCPCCGGTGDAKDCTFW